MPAILSRKKETTPPWTLQADLTDTGQLRLVLSLTAPCDAYETLRQRFAEEMASWKASDPAWLSFKASKAQLTEAEERLEKARQAMASASRSFKEHLSAGADVAQDEAALEAARRKERQMQDRIEALGPVVKDRRQIAATSWSRQVVNLRADVHQGSLQAMERALLKLQTAMPAEAAELLLSLRTLAALADRFFVNPSI